MKRYLSLRGMGLDTVAARNSMESPAKTPATQQQSILRLSVDNELRRRSESNASVFFRISNTRTAAV